MLWKTDEMTYSASYREWEKRRQMQHHVATIHSMYITTKNKLLLYINWFLRGSSLWKCQCEMMTHWSWKPYHSITCTYTMKKKVYKDFFWHYTYFGILTRKKLIGIKQEFVEHPLLIKVFSRHFWHACSVVPDVHGASSNCAWARLGSSSHLS